MSELLNNVGTFVQDNLIAHIEPPAYTMAVKVKAGAGKLKRGSVLARGEDGNFVLYGTTGAGENAAVIGVPSAILTVDVDATGEAAVAAVAYRTGCFNREAIILAEGYDLTAADEDALRNFGIVLSVML